MIKSVTQFGDPILHQPGLVTEQGITSDIQQTASDLVDTLQATGALGLAAQHIGSLARVLVMRSGDSNDISASKIITMIAPQLIWSSPNFEEDWEGSVSLPGVQGLVSRSTDIKIKYLEPSTGAKKQAEFKGLPARIWQHEYDQINGIWFLTKALKQRMVPDFL